MLKAGRRTLLARVAFARDFPVDVLVTSGYYFLRLVVENNSGDALVPLRDGTFTLQRRRTMTGS